MNPLDAKLTESGELQFRLVGRDWTVDPLDLMEHLVRIDEIHTGKDRAANVDHLRDVQQLMHDRAQPALDRMPTLYEAEVFYQLIGEAFTFLKKKRQDVVTMSAASLSGMAESMPAAGPA